MSSVLVQIKFFASLRDDLGVAGCCATLGPDANMADLVAHLGEQFGAASSALQGEGVRIAVNQELLPLQGAASRQLHAGDEIAFLPPVTGG